jgi:hypothetical protein
VKIRKLAAARDRNASLLVRFSGQRLLHPDGTLLAQLAGDGQWYTPDGHRAHGLTPSSVRDQDTIEQDHAWRSEAVGIITMLAESQQHLTSDDVWARIASKPSESRMMGNAFARAQHARVIAPTGNHQPSTRRENHGRPILIWQSLRYGQQTL